MDQERASSHHEPNIVVRSDAASLTSVLDRHVHDDAGNAKSNGHEKDGRCNALLTTDITC